MYEIETHVRPRMSIMSKASECGRTNDTAAAAAAPRLTGTSLLRYCCATLHSLRSRTLLPDMGIRNAHCHTKCARARVHIVGYTLMLIFLFLLRISFEA